MGITESVRKARLQLAERVLESLYDDLDEGKLRKAILGGLAGAGLLAGGFGAYQAANKAPSAPNRPAAASKWISPDSEHKTVDLPGRPAGYRGIKRLVKKTPFELAKESDKRLNR